MPLWRSKPGWGLIAYIKFREICHVKCMAYPSKFCPRVLIFCPYVDNSLAKKLVSGTPTVETPQAPALWWMSLVNPCISTLRRSQGVRVLSSPKKECLCFCGCRPTPEVRKNFLPSQPSSSSLCLQETFIWRHGSSSQQTLASKPLFSDGMSLLVTVGGVCRSLQIFGPGNLDCLGQECHFQGLQTAVLDSASSPLLALKFASLSTKNYGSSCCSFTGIIAQVPNMKCFQGFYSNLFSIPVGGVQLILNLKTQLVSLSSKVLHQVGYCLYSPRRFSGLNRHPKCLLANSHFFSLLTLSAFL